MATYVVPQVLVFQEFNLAIDATIRTLNAHIAGGHAFLVRHSQSDEKVLGFLDYYDALAEHVYSYPNKPAGSTVDTSYVKVFIDDALLRYHEDLSGGGYGTVKRVAGYSNRINSSAVNYKTTTFGDTTYARHASLLERDVQVGDTVKVRGVESDVEYIKWTYVKGFVQDAVAAVTGTATADTDNQGAESATTSHQRTAGADNCVDITSVDGSSYYGLVEGDVTETYTVLVTEGSVGGDLTTATLRVTSASGNDDVESVTPSAGGSPTNIGTRGLTATWNLPGSTSECSTDAVEAGVSYNDFVEGQTWEIQVTQAYVVVSKTAGGTYTGAVDAIYIVEVTKGGTVNSIHTPQVTVTTDNGSDLSGPTDVATSGLVAVGTKGVTITFSGSNKLVKGDRFTIAATAAGLGAAKTIVLGHNLDAAIQSTTDLDLDLYIRKDIEVNINRTEAPPQTNYSVDSTTVTLEDGITAYDSSWVDSGGTAQPLDVFSAEVKGYGKAYVEYRAWLDTLSTDVFSCSDVASLDDAISGALTPDNPLKWGVFNALNNSNGTPVRFTSVEDPNVVDDWLEVLERLVGRRDVYGLVPLTRDATVLAAYEAHVRAQSTETQGRWRMTWFNLTSDASIAIASASTSSDSLVVKATITEDTDDLAPGPQYTLVQITSGNVDLDTLGVVPGDIVRAQYTTDGFGGITYSEYVIDTVVNSETLILAAGPDSAVNVASKIEIWRNLTATTRASRLATQAGTYSHRRVVAVWPDQISSGGTSMEGYHLCAALAGLVSGVVPHQSLTNLQVAGFDDVSRTTSLFNSDQLNTMAGGGVWIVTQDPQSGSIFTRHAVTTAPYSSINDREEMVVRNVDSISYLFLDRFAPYIGISNVTPSMLDIIAAETLSAIQYLRQANFTQRLGGQLIDATITDLRPSVAFRDRIVLTLSLTIPYALNNLEVHLVV